MLLVESHDLSHAVVPLLADLFGEAVGIYVEFLHRFLSLFRTHLRHRTHISAHLHGGERGHIEFGDHDVAACTAKIHDALLIFIKSGIVHTDMALHSDAIDAEALLLKVVDNPHVSLALAGIKHGVVVDVEFGLRIRFMRILESEGNVFLAEDPIEGRVPVAAVVFYRLVHYVPAFDPAFIAAYHSIYMVFHALLQDFGTYIVAVLIHREPWSKL